MNNQYNRIWTRIKQIASQKDFNENARPIFYPGNDSALLIVPGFDDTPFMMQELSEYLGRYGFTVFTTCLPGRGLSLKELSKTDWQDWVASLNQDIGLLKEVCSRLIIIGFSTGATTALYSALQKNKQLRPHGLALISPALAFHPSFVPLSIQFGLMKLLQFLSPFPKNLDNRHLIFMDPVPRIKFHLMEHSSVRTVCELFKLAARVRQSLSKISCPLYIGQSRNDIVVSPKGAFRIIRSVSSSEIVFQYFKMSGHPVMVDIQKEDLYQGILKFIQMIIR